MRATEVRRLSRTGARGRLTPKVAVRQSTFADGANGRPKQGLPRLHLSPPKQVTSRAKTKDVSPASALSTPPQVSQVPNSMPRAPEAALLADPLLMEYASKLEDFERLRISCSNQVSVMTRSTLDKDGGKRGHGIPPDEPGAQLALRFIDAIKVVEKGFEKKLMQRMRVHPLYPFVKRTPGLGGKTVARLLGVIGDPYWNKKEKRPRMECELMSYCGVHGSNGSKRRGYAGKTKVWVIATTCIKMTGEPYVVTKGKLAGRTLRRGKSPYRRVYDDARALAVGKVHGEPCKRCGPSGSPAEPGSPWSEGHKHGHAVRLVMRRILTDLWFEAKRLYGEQAQ